MRKARSFFHLQIASVAVTVFVEIRRWPDAYRLNARGSGNCTTYRYSDRLWRVEIANAFSLGTFRAFCIPPFTGKAGVFVHSSLLTRFILIGRSQYGLLHLGQTVTLFVRGNHLYSQRSHFNSTLEINRPFS